MGSACSGRRLCGAGAQGKCTFTDQGLCNQRGDPERGIFPAALRRVEEEAVGSVDGDDRPQQHECKCDSSVTGENAEQKCKPSEDFGGDGQVR